MQQNGNSNYINVGNTSDFIFLFAYLYFLQ